MILFPTCLTVEDSNTDAKRLEIELRMAMDCIRSLEAARIKVKIAILKEQLAAQPDSTELFREMQELMQQEKQLKSEPKQT